MIDEGHLEKTNPGGKRGSWTAAALHPWDLSPAQARMVQARLSPRVETRDRLGAVRRVAGVDVGFENGGSTARAAVAVLDFPELRLIEHRTARRETTFPYIPGLLSFREIPVVLDALERLSDAPDLILCDGQGLAHPRRFGLACHLGVLANLPTIGVAKSRLTGTCAAVPASRGSWVPLLDGDEVIGAVVRTRSGVKPLFVSVGHRICLETAIDFVLACAPRYRLPETTRWADRLASKQDCAVPKQPRRRAGEQGP